ncbi:MAG TPA: TMEM175 family protein [Tepidisphaeraceae bacterium]|jgi:uncharacterized membrane protein
MEKGRTEAFSDGVFAIAITLLILEIRVPEHDETSNAQLVRELVHLWPGYLAFVASFATILVMWVNHHGLFTMLKKMNRGMLFANGFLLLVVTFINFPTALLARHLNDEGARTAAVFYCGTYLLVNVAYHLLLTAAERGKLFWEHVPTSEIEKVRRAFWMGSLVYSAATLIALVHALSGVIVCSLLWVLWARMAYRTGHRSD